MKRFFFVLQLIFLVIELCSSEYISSADSGMENPCKDPSAGRVEEADTSCPEWENGSLNGLQRTFWENGSLFSEEFFENGVRQGQARFFYESGAKNCEETYVHGLLEGKRYCWWENGTVQEVSSWRNGLLHSSSTHQPAFLSYDREGNVLERKNFLCGTAHGEELIFYPSGALKCKILFLMGKREGIQESWYENGKKESQAVWKEGKLHGKYRKWDEKGVLIFEADYDNGLRNEVLNKPSQR